ncbi:porin [Burkholderia cepacia]|nr:porin [Burkholderia cepacia]
MKTKIAAVAVLGMMGVSAYAQSSVTLYGRLDAGIEYMSGVPTGTGANGQATGSSSRFRAESGDWGTSLWGLKGVEDIGGGYKVEFKLENGFNTGTGAMASAGSLWNRWAMIDMSNDKYGTLGFGRQLTISNGLWDFDPFGQTNWSSASLVRGRNWPQSSNNISYQSPKFGGFDVYGQYSFSNATNWNGNGTTSQGRANGIQLTYTHPVFQIRGIYDEIRDSTNGILDDPFRFSREYFVGLNVFLGQFKIQGAYQASRTSAGSGVATGAPTTTTQEWGGLTWQASPALAVIGAVYHVNANNSGGNATMYTVGGSYNLSKRTLLDLQIATVRNSKSANFALNANSAGTATSTDNPLVGHSQSGVYAGIQHMF